MKALFHINGRCTQGTEESPILLNAATRSISWHDRRRHERVYSHRRGSCLYYKAYGRRRRPSLQWAVNVIYPWIRRAKRDVFSRSRCFIFFNHCGMEAVVERAGAEEKERHRVPREVSSAARTRQRPVFVSSASQGVYHGHPSYSSGAELCPPCGVTHRG